MSNENTRVKALKATHYYYTHFNRNENSETLRVIQLCRHILDLGDSSNNGRLDTTMILTPEDLEGSVIAPIIVPGVGHEPVGGSILFTPAHDTNGMTSKG